MAKLIGFRRFTSKKGTDTCIAQVLRAATDRELSTGTVGEVCDDVFMPSDQYDLLKAGDIGKELSFDYEISGGRPYLTNVRVK